MTLRKINAYDLTKAKNMMPVNLTAKTAALTFGLLLSMTAMAKNMSSETYRFLEQNIEVEFSAAKTRCTSLSGIAVNFCIADAESDMKKSKAELDAAYKTSFISGSEARVDANYIVAMQQCYTKVGSNITLCSKSAKSIRNKKIGNSNAQVKLLNGNALPIQRLNTNSAMPVIEETPRPFKKSVLI